MDVTINKGALPENSPIDSGVAVLVLKGNSTIAQWQYPPISVESGESITTITTTDEETESLDSIPDFSETMTEISDMIPGVETELTSPPSTEIAEVNDEDEPMTLSPGSETNLEEVEFDLDIDGIVSANGNGTKVIDVSQSTPLADTSEESEGTTSGGTDKTESDEGTGETTASDGTATEDSEATTTEDGSITEESEGTSTDEADKTASDEGTIENTVPDVISNATSSDGEMSNEAGIEIPISDLEDTDVSDSPSDIDYTLVDDFVSNNSTKSNDNGGAPVVSTNGNYTNASSSGGASTISPAPAPSTTTTPAPGCTKTCQISVGVSAGVALVLVLAVIYGNKNQTTQNASASASSDAEPKPVQIQGGAVRNDPPV